MDRLDSLLAGLDRTVQVGGDISAYIIRVEGALSNLARLNDPNLLQVLQALQEILRALQESISRGHQYQIEAPSRIYRGKQVLLGVFLSGPLCSFRSAWSTPI